MNCPQTAQANGAFVKRLRHRPLKSHRRHHRHLRQAVKTPASHAGFMGSNPIGVTRNYKAVAFRDSLFRISHPRKFCRTNCFAMQGTPTTASRSPSLKEGGFAKRNAPFLQKRHAVSRQRLFAALGFPARSRILLRAETGMHKEPVKESSVGSVASSQLRASRGLS